jgi:hypothetical protein
VSVPQPHGCCHGLATERKTSDEGSTGLQPQLLPQTLITAVQSGSGHPACLLVWRESSETWYLTVQLGYWYMDRKF